jgi:hypothetical protein
MKMIAQVKRSQSWDLLRIAVALLVGIAIVATATGSPMPTSANRPTDVDRPIFGVADATVERSVGQTPASSFDTVRSVDSEFSAGDSSPYQLEAARPPLNDIWLDVRQLARVSCVM